MATAQKEISSKDLEILSELMLMEDLTYKKHMAYAKQLKDEQLKDACMTLAENCKARFTALNNYLNAH